MHNDNESQLLIDKAADIPRYRQVKMFINQQIKHQDLRRGVKLSSVAKLAKLLRVSKVTVVKATAELIDEGVLYSEFGSGTFVADPAGKKTHTICFVIHSGSYITAPYFSQLVAGISEVADAEHYKLQFITSARVARTIDHGSPYPQSKELRWADGLIIMDNMIADNQVVRLAEQLPVVVLGRVVYGSDIACVRANNRDGTYQAVSHLAKLGHKRIAIMVTSEKWQTDREKVRGYRSAVAELGLDAEADLVAIVGTGSETSQREHLSNALNALLSLPVPPTAIFVSDDTTAFTVLQWVKAKALRVPEDIAVMSFGGCLSDILADLPLTTMQLPITQMGQTAAETLLAMIHEEEVTNKDIIFTPKLVVRQSCGGGRIQNTNLAKEECEFVSERRKEMQND